VSFHEQQTVPAPGGPGRPEQSPWVRAGIVGLAVIVVGVLIAGSIWLSQKDDDSDGPATATDPQGQGSWEPRVVEEDGVPVSLDFTGTAEPSGKLQVAVLTEGEGEVTETGDTATVHYLGQLREEPAPFDESYSRGTTFDVQLGAGRVIQGWDEGLVGVPAGSRVLLEIPSEMAYGPSGNGPIPPDATLYFVVDVVAIA